MIYDSESRENEIDLVTPSETITPVKIRRLRKDAGGLICVTVPPTTWKAVDLPLLQDVYRSASNDFPILTQMRADDIPYDEKSTFSLSVNHRDTFTGITDIDRALTIKRSAEIGKEIMDDGEEGAKIFGSEFRTPGHVFLLNASEGLLDKRMGHTELATALLMHGDIYPSMTICEMMSDDGNSMDEEEAKAYGKENDIPFLHGKDIKDSWEGGND